MSEEHPMEIRRQRDALARFAFSVLQVGLDPENTPEELHRDAIVALAYKEGLVRLVGDHGCELTPWLASLRDGTERSSPFPHPDEIGMEITQLSHARAGLLSLIRSLQIDDFGILPGSMEPVVSVVVQQIGREIGRIEGTMEMLRRLLSGMGRKRQSEDRE